MCACLLALAACGKKKASAPAPASAKPAAAAPARLADAGPAESVQEWSYSSAGKRDPFHSFVADLASARAQSLETQCATPLGKFELEQLRLVAVITGLDDPVAMVEAPNGHGYSLHRGACIGRNGGVISSVRTGEVVVAEWVVRADGTRERADTVLRLPKEPTLEIEE